MKEREGHGKGNGKGNLQKLMHLAQPLTSRSLTRARSLTLYSNSLSLTFHECRSPQLSWKETPHFTAQDAEAKGRGHSAPASGPRGRAAMRPSDSLSSVSPVPSSPSQGLLEKHREPGVSEAP